MFFRTSAVSIVVHHLAEQSRAEHSRAPNQGHYHNLNKNRKYCRIPPLAGPDLNTALQPPLIGDNEYGKKSEGI